MEFEETDYVWDDFHSGLSEERRQRYEEVLKGILKGVENILKEHNEGHKIIATIPEGIFSVGVTGDKRRYAPVVTLAYDVFPGYESLERMSVRIANNLPVSRVIYDLTHKVASHPENPDIGLLIRRDTEL